MMAAACAEVGLNLKWNVAVPEAHRGCARRPEPAGVGLEVLGVCSGPLRWEP